MSIRNYKIIREIAKTNFSIVYLGLNINLNKQVVVKELNLDISKQGDFITYLRREAEFLKRINHKNVVKFFDYFEEKNKAFLVLEYIEGKNIYEYIQEKRILNYYDAENIFKQMCYSVLEIHKLGIIHKDIKPSNFLIDKNGIVKLIDLGISTDLIKQDPNFERAFTKSFAAPEQIKEKVILDVRTDIYSLGKTYYFLLTSRLPEGETVLINKQDIENEIKEFRDPRHFNLNIPVKTIEIIRKCLQEDRNKRYQSVKLIIEDLEKESRNDEEYSDFNFVEYFEGNFVLDKNIDDSEKLPKYWRLNVKLSKLKLKPKNPTHILNLIHNYINRGNPTLCSLKLARWLSDKFPDTIVEESDGISFKFNIINKDSTQHQEIKHFLSLAAAIQNSLLILLKKGIISLFDDELAFSIEKNYQDFFRVVIEDFLELAKNYFYLTDHPYNEPYVFINDSSKTYNIKFLIGNSDFFSNSICLSEDKNITDSFHINASIPVPYIFNEDENSKNSLLYFLNNIFRFKDFRFGQLKIITRALSLRNTVGLLPTGAGKSLCYQIMMFLQPAPIIVVEPIKSLIVDQLYNLKKFLIDRINIVTSDQSSSERDDVQNLFSKGKFLCLYVSPERFQTKKFRDYLDTFIKNFPISYAVIDEAHCVSEWGHDFRTSYLGLAQTIRKYCNHNGFIPTFYALTGTASEIVLRDILSDLEILEEYKDAVIRNYTFDRKELKLSVLKCSSLNKFQQLLYIFDKLSEYFKLTSADYLFKSNKIGCGLIFCPHVNSTDFSVAYLNKKIGESFSLQLIGVEKDSKSTLSPNCPKCCAQMELRTNRRDHSKFWGCSRYPNCKGTLKVNNNSFSEKVDYFIKHFQGLGMFSGTPIRGFSKDSWDLYKREIQIKFIEDKISCMISTKSFGMGIDKPNVRYTIHYNLPQSIEAFYQEAGRAGRDGKTAYCFVIFSDDNPDYDNTFLDISKKADELWTVNHNSNSDIGRNLFFQKEAYIGENYEKEKILTLLNKYIYKELNQINTLSIKEIEIPNADENEKFLFRLKSFGLINDYYIKYYPIRGNSLKSSMVISLQKLNPNEYSKNLIDYFKLRNEKLFVENIEAELKKTTFSGINQEIEYCVNKVISFVYEKIEPQRRASLRNIVDACRSETDEEFRNKVLRYLSPDEEINLEFNIFPNSKNYEHWIGIINKAIISEQLDKFLGVTLRILESYPQEPGLIYVSFALRMLLPNENQNLIKEDLIAFIRFYKMYFGNKQLDLALISVLELLFVHSNRDEVFNQILKIIVKNIENKSKLMKLASLRTNCTKTKLNLQTILLALIRGKFKIKKINLGKYEKRG
jgi:ATP-dependent DNA helicase RecQ